MPAAVDRPVLAGRLAALRAWLAANSLDGVVVPRFDAHQGEYVAAHDERLRYLTGFSGSAGVALVTAEKAIIWVDGRYQVQVRQEVDLAAFAVEHYDDAPIEGWLEQHATPRRRIGLNPMLFPTAQYGKLKAALEKRGAELIGLGSDPIDAIWPDQPDAPLSRIAALPPSHAGESSMDKRRRIASELADAGADLLVETQPDNIAWLLNVRGSDVTYNPLPHSFLLIDREAGVEWFVDERKFPNARDGYELDGVAMRSPSRFLSRVGERAGGATVLVDPDFAPVAATLGVEANSGRVLHRTSPVTLAKAVKNAGELAGYRAAHLEDGLAWTRFMAWLHREGPAREQAGKPIREIEAEEKILALRQLGDGFVEPSFRSISAAGSNAAMCHYAAAPSSQGSITSAGVYLLDSGGQYTGGTTDATRTTALGPVSDGVRRTYTAVLRGFISLMTLQFPLGTEGHQIDAFARRPLWDLGLDYDHGTGHGVGHFLSVHEQPHRFEKRVNPHKLVAGQVMTVEPGYYLEGGFGMRVENQVEIVAGMPGFLRFDSLTLVPIDLKLADLTRLSGDDIAFLNAYHARVREALVDRIGEDARGYLIEATAPAS